MKKFTALLMIAILVLTMGAAVSAETLDDVTAALQNAKFPATFISQAQSYFTANPMTAEQTGLVLKYINQANSAIDGSTDLSKLSDAQYDEIITNVTKAAEVVGLKAILRPDETIGVYDASGKLVFALSRASLAPMAGGTPSDAVKQTGYDYSLVLIGLLTILLAGITAVASQICARRSQASTAA